MRRFLIFVLCLMCLAVSVSASEVSQLDNAVTVESDGSCRVTLELTLVLDGPAPDFPVPAKAQDITVNSVRASSTVSGSVRNISLSEFATGTGTHHLRISYRLPKVITTSKQGGTTLSLTLLSGFSYPVEKMDFSIVLPKATEEKPEFFSTYYQDSVDIIMDWSQQGAMIKGTFLQPLLDHETVTMTLKVDSSMFQQSLAPGWTMDTLDTLIILAALLAIVYWFAAMGSRPPQRLQCSVPPAGINAGEISSRITGKGADLTLMVLSWAQMGYLVIQSEDSGRVLLHRRMQMGNERSDFENRCFRELFGRRSVINGTGQHYARLYRKVARHVPEAKTTFRRNSGDARLLRLLGACVSILSGVSLAVAYGDGAGGETALAILLGVAGLLCAWQIQNAAGCLFSRSKLPMILGGSCALAWLLLSIPAGEWNVALLCIPFQFLVGLAAFYSGRRTATGKLIMSELLGLRRHLRSVSKEETKRMMRLNPNYFYDMAPFALALDADRALVRQMGNLRLPQCTWLDTGMDGPTSPKEWDQLLRDTVNALDQRQRRLFLDRLLGR